MRGIAIMRAADIEPVTQHPIAGHRANGAVTSRLVSPPGYSLWMVALTADADTELHLPERHGDEALYVLAGAVALDERTCAAGGALIIESRARPRIEVLERSHLVHMGPADPEVPIDGLNGPVERPGGDVHVVGPAGAYAVADEYRDSRYYADSTCPTCRLTLLYTSRTSAYVSSTHSHSTDELIHVVHGRLDLGSIHIGPGDTLAVEADRRYGFRTPGAFAFINYRRDASEQTVERGSMPRLEGALVNGFAAVIGPR